MPSVVWWVAGWSDVKIEACDAVVKVADATSVSNSVPCSPKRSAMNGLVSRR